MQAILFFFGGWLSYAQVSFAIDTHVVQRRLGIHVLLETCWTIEVQNFEQEEELQTAPWVENSKISVTYTGIKVTKVLFTEFLKQKIGKWFEFVALLLQMDVKDDRAEAANDALSWFGFAEVFSHVDDSALKAIDSSISMDESFDEGKIQDHSKEALVS